MYGSMGDFREYRDNDRKLIANVEKTRIKP